jgi:hypothetical protein
MLGPALLSPSSWRPGALATYSALFTTRLHHTLHHCNRYWLLCWLPLDWTRRWLTVVDHTKVINELLAAGLLDGRRFDGGTIVKIDRTTAEIDRISAKIDRITDRTTAWVMVTAVWKENLQNNSRIQSADACATGLTDITHSAGAARIGAIFALVAVVVLVGLDFSGLLGRHSGLKPSWWVGLIAILMGLVLVVLHHFNYLRSGKLMERFIHEVLSDTLWARKNEPATEALDEHTGSQDNPPKPSPQPTVTFVDCETGLDARAR